MNGVLALIPARSGSQTVPHKNLRDFRGKPLLVHAIEQALACASVDRTVVSTDSPEYAAIARAHGAETPFLRPPEISGDNATDLEVFTHALNWLAEHESYHPELCVHLRPTYPLRAPAQIEEVIGILRVNEQLDAVRSVSLAQHTPFKMWLRDDNGTLLPVIANAPPEAHSLPRQILPAVYLQNAAIDAVRSSVILERRSMTGTNIYGYVMDHCFDIDTEADLQQALTASV
jgi:CMP-N,N'-diacetyllegionaminic acid synthase